MIVLLGIFVFGAYMVFDILKDRQRYAELRSEGEPFHEAMECLEPTWVAGFKLPPVLNYHRGHMWVHWVSSDLAYIGVDDFARRLLGKRARLSLPSIGNQVGQGEGVLKVDQNGEEVYLLSPVGGEIISVNSRLKHDPELIYRDNYGQGWIYKIRSPLLFKELPNLLEGSLAKRWTEDTRNRFQHQLMLVSGNVIQDGGESIEDIASGLDSQQWRTLAREFLSLKSA